MPRTLSHAFSSQIHYLYESYNFSIIWCRCSRSPGGVHASGVGHLQRVHHPRNALLLRPNLQHERNQDSRPNRFFDRIFGFAERKSARRKAVGRSTTSSFVGCCSTSRTRSNKLVRIISHKDNYSRRKTVHLNWPRWRKLMVYSKKAKTKWPFIFFSRTLISKAKFNTLSFRFRTNCLWYQFTFHKIY